MVKKRKHSARASMQAHRTMPASRQSRVEMEKLGHYAFFIGLLLAVASGLFATRIVADVVLITLLVLLGLIVGLLNITMKETDDFLIAAVALMLAGVVNLGLIPIIGVYLRAILTNIVVFVVPAAVLVSLRSIWVLANRR